MFAAVPGVLPDEEESEEQINAATNNRRLGLGILNFGSKILKRHGKKIIKVGQEILNGKN